MGTEVGHEVERPGENQRMKDKGYEAFAQMQTGGCDSGRTMHKDGEGGKNDLEN